MEQIGAALGDGLDEMPHLGMLRLDVEVPDTQSHPTNVELPKATPDGSLQPLGKVRGIRTNDEGQPMMGGGYTWFLFKPVTVGSATLNVKYAPNGGGDPVDQTYELNIVEQK